MDRRNSLTAIRVRVTNDVAKISAPCPEVTTLFARRVLFCALALFFFCSKAMAADVYEITSRDGDKEVTYKVKFGGLRMADQYTAFDPETKSFVYLTWKRTDEAPKPAITIWNHLDGSLLELYQFPDAKHPLPIIPGIEAMKVCPLTGDKTFEFRFVGYID